MRIFSYFVLKNESFNFYFSSRTIWPIFVQIISLFFFFLSLYYFFFLFFFFDRGINLLNSSLHFLFFFIWRYFLLAIIFCIGATRYDFLGLSNLLCIIIGFALNFRIGFGLIIFTLLKNKSCNNMLGHLFLF